MSFALSDEQVEFRDTLRRFLAEVAPPAEVRRLLETDAGFDEGVWKQMAAELGLQGIAIPERFGGQGFGNAELCLATAEMGRSLLPSPFFSSVVLAGGAIAHVAAEHEKAELLGDIAAGSTATLAFLEPAATERTTSGWNAANIAMEATPDGDGFRLSGCKSFVLDGHTARHIVVAAREPGSAGDAGIGLFRVDGDAGELGRERLVTLDATRTQAHLDFNAVPARALGDAGSSWPALQRALCEALVALAAEMTGGMEFVLETAVGYATTRHQFGRAIGSFQAIKHKCADLHILLEGARSAVRIASLAADEDDPELPMLASIAKAHCGDAFALAAQENIQIHGGVGFTWEYDAHLYLRRALSSQILLGDTAQHRERVARLLEQEVR